MALEQEIKVLRFQHGYGEMLLDGLTKEKAFDLVCAGGVNPAWIIGHLGFVSNLVATMIGGESKIDLDQWKPLFGGGSTPTTDASAYPTWDELLRVWRQGADQLADLTPKASGGLLGQPNPNARMKDALPTVHDFLSFVLTAHVAMHLGQLSTWRRSQGHPPLF